MTSTTATLTDPKQYVGKKHQDEALVIGWQHHTATTQTVTVEWPAHHAFYTPAPGAHSPLLLTESIRQALALVCHTSYDIPVGHRMGWEHIRFHANPAALRTTGAPVRADLRVTHSAVTRRRLGSARLTAHVIATVGNTYAGSAEIHYSAHPAAIYDRLRGRYADAALAFAQAPAPAEPVPAHRVGRSEARDVTLTPTDTPNHFGLRVDTSHPVLFDHPHDHIPGMVLLEAAGQAVLATATRPVTLTGFETDFHHYVEFDAPCTLTTAPAPPGLDRRPRTLVTAHQNNREVFTSLIATAQAAAR
ncbi:ScbA/BarX family gamma-butyrolactone biosynthesis protein [Streptomyces sp. NPDC002054]|uniref:ScbA/BarX family gamma-butyrolactone biosynthesis protein n=1 Tax=Streptomyces sp. NPDC002054 TaxID=3154663 RepID=UPI003328D6F3